MVEILFRWRRLYPLVLLLVAAMLVAGGCGDDDDDGGSSSTATATATATQTAMALEFPTDIGKDDSADITGAGATFPAPVYQAWFVDYKDGVASGVSVNYQSIGSGGGIEQFTAGTVDFGASDAPMSEEEIAKVPDVVHVPTVIGAIVVTYNLDGLSEPLTLDGDTLAKIFLGEITKWNDPAIAALNSGADLPDAEITVVHRSDGSGTSFGFTDYLTHVSSDWSSQVGTSKNPNWPVGQGGKGNEGVTNVVKQTPDAIGYVELSYAIANDLSYANLVNADGATVTPSLDSASAAAAGVEIPADYRVSIVNAGGDGYPIASFTYLLLHQDMSSCSIAEPLVHMLWWVYHDPVARQDAIDLTYSPLPDSLLPRIDDTLKSLTCEGNPILP